MTLVDPVRPDGDALANLLEFETLLSELSTRFILLPPEEVDREVEDALRRVCGFLRLDLAVLWQWSATEPAEIAPTHVYCGVEGAGPTEPLRHEQYPWSREQVLSGRVIAMASPDDLPPGAAVDRDTCLRSGIRSSLCLPLVAGGVQAVGALGFNTLRSSRTWPDYLVKRLQLVAQIFTNALLRKRQVLDLQASEARLALAAESADAGLWTLDYGTGIFWATERARAIFGYRPDEVVDVERLLSSVHPDDRDLVKGEILRPRASHEPFKVEYRILVPESGRVRWIASSGRFRPGNGGGSGRLTGVSIDITARRLAEEGHRLTEARLASATALAGLGFYELDMETGEAYLDRRFREICGVPPHLERSAEVLEAWKARMEPDDLQRILALRERLHAGGLDQISAEYRCLHPTHGSRWIHHLARVSRRDAAGHALATFGVVRDVTEARQAEADLRDLGRRLIRAHEEERAMLARELHDDLTQRLAVLAIDVGRVERSATDDAQAATLRSVREGIVRISEDIHALAYQLHPSVLEELGLVEALRAECDRFGPRLRVELSTGPGVPAGGCGKETALCLFRVAQEALSNVVRHAGAGSARVTLRPMRGGLELVVLDDGVGFEPARLRVRSLGLVSMRERVRLIGGTLHIDSAPGHGTSVIVWVPLEGGSR